MGRGRSKRNCDKEYELNQKQQNQLQVLKKEIKKLARERDFYKKQLDKLDTACLEVAERYQEEDRLKISENQELKRRLVKWKCRVCGEGVLILHMFKRQDGDFYFRKCSSKECTNRTRLQKCPENGVNGILPKDLKTA